MSSLTSNKQIHDSTSSENAFKSQAIAKPPQYDTLARV